MNKAYAQTKWFYRVAMIAAAACVAWTVMDMADNGANAADFVALAALTMAIVALYLSNRQKFLAPAPASSGEEPDDEAGQGYQWTPAERAEAEAQHNRRLSAFVGAMPTATKPFLAPEKEYRNGDWLTFLPAAAKVIDLEQREDGSHWVVYQMPSDYPGNHRKALMTLAPQRAVADIPAVRAEFDRQEPSGLVVEEVGDEDEGFTPFGEGQGPGVIGDENAVAVLDEGQIGDPAYRRSKIDHVRRKRHNAHWLAEANRTGKLQGAAGAYLEHLLAGADAAPVAQYLEHAKQLVARAEAGQLALPGKLDTPLGQQLAVSTKTAQEGATLALALIEEVQRLEEQRDELACRLIQAIPTAIDRKREQSFFEAQEESRSGILDGDPDQLVTYHVTDKDSVFEVVGFKFTEEQRSAGAEHLVALSDVSDPNATTLRIVDPVHWAVMGHIVRKPSPSDS